MAKPTKKDLQFVKSRKIKIPKEIVDLDRSYLLKKFGTPTIVPFNGMLRNKLYWPIEKLKNWEENPRSITTRDFARLKCLICGNEFAPYHSNHKYCSLKCHEKQRRSLDNRREYMRQYLRSYYQTKDGREIFRRSSAKYRASNLGKLFSMNDKARRRGAIGDISSKYWNWLLKRTGGRCMGCGKIYPLDEIQRDHIVPITMGGENVNWNVQPLCSSCNKRKSNRIIVSHIDNYFMDMLYGEYLIEQKKGIPCLN